MNKLLRKKILQMVKKDQAMRKSGKWDSKIDKMNTRELKKIVKKYGWPDINLVGKKGSNDAWLIIQHADHDIKFQKECLKLMKKKMREGKIALQNVAYLTDRVRVNQGLSQLYGTQFYLKDNKLIPRPIKDKKDLNKRRKNFGLEFFSKYKGRLIKSQKRIRDDILK